ncbi:MAG: histidine kinase [Nocardioidaceae bacterium]|nr:histidine kinase [Nocardioidaceae bacterium]
MPLEPPAPRALTPWGHVWRLVLVLLVSGLTWSTFLPWQWDHARWWLVLDVVLGLVSLVLVHRRREHPVPVATAVVLMGLVSASSAGPGLLALVSLATRRRWREVLPVALLSLVVNTVRDTLNPGTDDTWATTAALTLLATVVTVVVGLALGSRHDLWPALRGRLAAVTPTTEPDEPSSAPPLTRWGHAWRLVVVLAISGIAWATYAEWQWRNDPWWLTLDVALGLTALVLMQWRRRRPLMVAVVITLFGVVSASSGGPATLVLVSLATRRRWREIVPVGLLSVVAGAVLATLNPATDESWWFNTIATLVIVGLTVGWGLYIGSRRELLATLRTQLATAEREQTMRVAQARTAERSRIAREMHDVLAHRISMVAMHAGALSYRTDLPAEEVRRTTTLIQQSAHEALVDLREVLGVLREDEPSADERPQPTMEDIPTLVEEARSTGSHVDFDNRLVGAELPVGLGRTTYRIVQEALTNARKHAPHTRVDVRVAGGPDEGVVITVTNPLQVGTRTLRTPPSGLGLIGLSERASLAGGTLDCRRTDREFTVEATLPWPA